MSVFRGQTACVNGIDTVWRVYWRYEIGELPPGAYGIYFHYWIDHQFIDGGDYDGDGEVDHFPNPEVGFPDEGWVVNFTIQVVE